MNRRTLVALATCALTSAIAFAADDSAKPLLLQKPAISRTEIAFSYAGDLWIVSREGGVARRLTSAPGVETDPAFSPDGSMVAFTGEYDGNIDLYVVPSSGGVPKRLTTHPADDYAVGWTPDGKRVLFRSTRSSYSRYPQLFTVDATGGNPDVLPLPMAAYGSYSNDGSHLAYMPYGFLRPMNVYDSWRRYRGGRATSVWIANLSDSAVEKVPRTVSNDSHPMWIGNQIFFLSDRNGANTLFSYDTKSKAVKQVIANNGMDIKWAKAGPDAIVYDQFGVLHVFDVKSGKEHQVDVTLEGDLPEVRPRFENVSSQIQSAGLSPSGARAVFEAHGEILTVPAEKGDIRNLTNTAGVMERSPAWSPDGRKIAYFSDEGGEYALHVRNQNGTGDVKKIALADSPTFYFKPVWSPDSEKIVYFDKARNVWYVAVDGSAKPVKVDQNTYYDPQPGLDPSWSPDSKWIAYTKELRSHLRAVFVYSLAAGKATQLTDGLSDARYARFDRNGLYLYFTAGTNTGPTVGWLDMSSDPFQVTRSVWLAVLQKTTASPLAPESDEEKPADETKKDEKKEDSKKVPEVRIDFENIGQRIVSIPGPPRSYTGLEVGKTGVVFLQEGAILHKFDLKTRKMDKLLEGVGGFDVSANGEKMLYSQAGRWFIASTSAPPKPGEGALKLETMEVRVDPRAEWRQMFDETWRIERDFFYDPGLHGLDWKSARKKYEPYLDRLAARADLNYLFTEMLSDITVGHLYIRGGKTPQVKPVKGGLLGADYKIENGRYRIARIYNGENWNPELKAPLTQPGVNVSVGDYLIAVNGRDLKASDEVYSLFEGTAGRTISIRVSANPGGSDARDIQVVPVESETALRNRAWIEDNRRKVDQMSGGKVAYVYLPDTAGGGYTSFNRYYFAQAGREAVVLDERFNGGGQAADYIINMLARPLVNYWTTRDGEDFTTPAAGIFGPKAMIINEFAGSGGDLMPWYFRQAKLGPLVGKRTWGGLVGILGFPTLMDGGSVTAPNVAFWNLNSKWEIENHGVAPDIEVELDPKAVREGRDPQLERAVQVIMEALKKSPMKKPVRPAFPNYNSPAGTGVSAGSR